MGILAVSMKRHGSWHGILNLSDFLAWAMASFFILSLTMWPIVAFLHGGFTFPQQATQEQRFYAAVITCAIWFVLLYWRPQVALLKWFRNLDKKNLTEN